MCTHGILLIDSDGVVWCLRCRGRLHQLLRYPHSNQFERRIVKRDRLGAELGWPEWIRAERSTLF